MKRRAILQIGTEKTGTTTLQHFLAANRAQLAAKGFRYPRFCGAINHTGLAALALDPAKVDSLREPFGVRAPSDIPAMRQRLRQAANVELADGATTIFCSEHCHSRLKTAEEVATLREFLTAFFDDIQISVYLRRQDQVALSLYSTRLKSGETETRILPRTHAGDLYFNYDRSLALWEDAFGQANIHVRLFDRKELIGGSIVSDIVDRWQLGEIADFAAVPDQNESIQPLAQEYLRRLNPRLEPLGNLPIEEVRGPLGSRLALLFPGRGARPSRADAEAFYNLYRPSNEAVRQRYFPDRPALFSDDFDGYPEVEDSRDLSLDDFAAIAAALHRFATSEARRLEAEIAIREARLHWVRDEPQAAEAALRRALGWRPEHAEAHRVLAEYLLRLDRLDEAVDAARQAATLRPDSYEYWHFLGVLLRRTRDFKAAAEAQQRAVDLNPSHAASKHELAQVLIKQADAEHQRTARQA